MLWLVLRSAIRSPIPVCTAAFLAKFPTRNRFAMHSRPLLDYLAYPEELSEPSTAPAAAMERPMDPLEARLKDLEARLRANETTAPAPKQDLTLSAQIEAILKRKAAPEPAVLRQPLSAEFAEQGTRPARVTIEPPPTAPASNDAPVVDQEFLKFTEAVYLIGQAARRFIEQPQPQPAPREVAGHQAPSTGEIEVLSAVLREAVSAFRSVADDLAVSAGEIRNFATREERLPPRRRPQPARYRDDDEIVELRESIADLQDRLDDLLHARRRGRY